MIWKIAKKDFLLNLMTFKFAVGTIVCVILTAVFMPVLVSDYQQRLKTYNDNVARNEAELRKVRVYKNITPTIYRPPAVLSVFGEGIEKQISNSAKIELASTPEISATSVETNPFLSIFPTLDVSLIFKIVVSILALLLTCDVISGERGQGTLKLMLSGRVSRHQVLLGKLLAGLATLVIPTTVSFVIGLIILQFYPMVDLTGTDWTWIVLMFAASLIFISGMVNLGLLISCLARNSAVSLMLGLFFWVVFVIVIPNGATCLATQLQPIESAEKTDSQIRALWDKFDNELVDFEKTLPGRGNYAGDLGAFGQYYAVICDKTYLESGQKRYPFAVPLQVKYADQVLDIQRTFLNGLTKQKSLAENLSRISPISVYENIMSATNLASFHRFTDRVKTYRNNVIEYVRSKTDDFSSPSYFTISKEGEWKELQKRIRPEFEAQTKADRKKIHEDFMNWKERIKNSRRLNLQDFPIFIYQPESVFRTIERVVADLGLLIFVNVLFFALSFLAFMKYDIR